MFVLLNFDTEHDHGGCSAAVEEKE